MKMARRIEFPFNSRRYIGNKNKMEVHDLDNENNNCQIDEIKRENVTTFFPDTLDQAHIEGYDNCRWCLENSKR